MPPKKNLTGMTFGTLFVVKEIEERIGIEIYWECVCECGNIINVRSNSLLTGNTTGCTECGYKKSSVKRSAYNTFKLMDNYYIGYDKNKQEFYFDIEKFEDVKLFYWGVNKNGYVNGHITDEDGIKRTMGLHRYVMNLPTNDERIIDHIDRNPRNCLLSNLRIATYKGNSINASVAKSSKTGVVGVNIYEVNRFVAHIQNNGKHVHLGIFNIFDDAVYSRLCAEKQYYGEYAPQKHLYSQYGIEED